MFSHLSRTLRKIAKREGAPAAEPDDQSDDYDWSSYSAVYRDQIDEIETQYALRLAPEDARFDGSLHVETPSLSLHPNHFCLYETIGVLGPRSVVEVGCGGGDHLHNLKLLFSDMDVAGIDRSEGQLAFLRERNPDIGDSASVADITMPWSNRVPKADLVYTQAVVMHIRAANSPYVALSNIFRMATRHVVLMENFHRHNFAEMIDVLFQGGMIDWPEVNLFFRRFDRTPHILVASNESLDLEHLTAYDALLG